MKVRMTVGMSGPGLLLEPGDECNFPDPVAVKLIAAGSAVPVAEAFIETMTAAPALERRVRRRATPAPAKSEA